MATTDTFTFGSSTHPFELSFPFINEDNLVVTLDGVEQQLGTDYTVINKTSNTAAGVGFLSGARIQFTASPLPTTGAVKVVRNTTLETTSTFKTGSAIRAIDLNSNFTQNLYVTEEISNNAILTDGSNAFDGDLNMGGNQITNLGTPATDSDAVTKLYVDSRFSSQSIPGYTRWRTTATASQTIFSGVGESGGTLAYSATRENVYVNGALQQRTVDYTADNGTTITFIVGLQAGDIVDVVCVNNVSTVTSDQSSELYFLQSGTGAETRTVESKLKDVVSVFDFIPVSEHAAIKNNTSTYDAATAIQTALASIPSPQRAILYFPPGQYRTGSSITVPSNYNIDAERATFNRIGSGVFTCFVLEGGLGKKYFYQINNYDVGIEVRGNVNNVVFEVISNCRQGVKLKPAEAISSSANLDNRITGTQIGFCTDGIVIEQTADNQIQQGNEIRVNFVSNTLNTLVFDDNGVHTEASNWDGNLIVLQASDPFFQAGATLLLNRSNFAVSAITYKIESWAGGWNAGDGTITVIDGKFLTCNFFFSFANQFDITDFCSAASLGSIAYNKFELARSSSDTTASAQTAVTSGTLVTPLRTSKHIVKVDVPALLAGATYGAWFEHVLVQTSLAPITKLLSVTGGNSNNYSIRIVDSGGESRGRVRVFVTNNTPNTLSASTINLFLNFGG